MKSKLLQQGVDSAFFEDLKVLSRLKDEPFREMIDLINRYDQPGRRLPKDEDLIPIARKHQVLSKDLLTALKVSLFLYNQQQDENDPIPDILDDLISSEKISQTESQTIAQKIEIARPLFAGKIKRVGRIQADLAATFPVLEHFHSRCTAISRFEPLFDRFKDDPKKYSPKVANLTSVLLLQLDVDRYGTTERFAFALTETELDELLNHLELAKVQLKTLNTFLPKGESPNA